MRGQAKGGATWFLIVVAGAVLGLTAYEAASRTSMPLVMWAPAAILLVVLVAWPFLMGWRPFRRIEHELHDCPSCGTQWRPADEEGSMKCPACAGAA